MCHEGVLSVDSCRSHGSIVVAFRVVSLMNSKLNLVSQ